MKLSPLEVRKQEFNRTMRGYDVEEVRAFLSTVATQMDDLLEEQAKAESDLSEHKSKMGHLEDVQEALQATLNMARKNAEDARQAALSKAELIVHEAHLKSEEILKKAERELDKLRSDITHLETRRDQMLAKLKSVLTAELEMLDSIKPEKADKQKDSGVEVAQLAFIDPAARAHREEMLAKARAAAAAQLGQTRAGKRTDEAESVIPDEDESESDDGETEHDDHAADVPDIGEVVASLRASVDEEAEAGDEADEHDDDTGGLEEMQKIRRILDDLE